MNIFDKIVEVVNPAAAVRREHDRFKLQTIRSIRNSGYDESGAARNKNSMRGWLASSKTPQEDIDKNIPILRQRSRSLYMSAPLAVSAIKTNRTNIIGEGLKLKSTIDAEFLNLRRSRPRNGSRRRKGSSNSGPDQNFAILPG